MPELAEDMYCSQQICIPPTFPYLLRQYAKAAIRTQPADLLRWSTAYFRCLALNLPPPVKPRLEYPIPKSHFGLTPGWLRALMQQLQNNLTVPFKVLWDRWIGACLLHQNLIEVLVLGGFNDPQAVPWLRFVALCAAHLTDTLTQTMIMVCEILTEEPEGGSAMIPLEVFTDVYQFLAAIDASEPQWLRNLHFTDSLLSLYREPSIVEVKESVSEIEVEEEEESIEAEEEKEIEIEAGPEEDLVGVVISCPDIAADDYKTEEDFLTQEMERQEKESAAPSDLSTIYAEAESNKDEVSAKEEAVSMKGNDMEDELEGDTISKKDQDTLVGDLVSQASTKPASPITAEATGKESVDTIVGYMPPRQGQPQEAEEQEVEKAESEELMGEEEEEQHMDEEIEKLKRVLHQAAGPEVSVSEIFESEASEKREEIEEEEEPEEKGELIYIDVIPGIGATVPERLVEAVVKYMDDCATIQHGMVMPRNIRHFNCPPLEAMS